MEKQVILLSSLFFLSSAIWMPNTVDYLGWSVLELGSVFLLIRWIVINKSITVPSRNFLLPFLLVILWSAISAFWSCNFHATLTAIYKLFFILFTITLFLNRTELWEKSLSISLIFLCLVISLLWWLSPVSYSWRAGTNLFGGFLSLGAICSLGKYMGSRRQSVNSLYLALSIFISITLFMVGSLGPILAWVFGSILLFVLHKQSRMKMLILFFGTFSLLLLIVHLGHLTGEPVFQVLQKRLHDRYSTERLRIWKDSLSYFYRHPFLGTGIGTFRDVYPEFKKIAGLRNAPYAHNETLNLLCEMGLIGCVPLLWLGWKILTKIKNTFVIPAQAGIQSFKQVKELDSMVKPWLAITLASLVQSLFDFNLRFPPLLIPFIFSLTFFSDSREFSLEVPAARRFLSGALSALGILFILPGAAWIEFTHPPKGMSQSSAAQVSAILDPFNGLYRSQTGRLRDMLAAIELEPRNVWYRRQAAQFYFFQWKAGKNKENLKSAVEQYDQILKFAPGVPQFTLEDQQLRNELKL